MEFAFDATFFAFVGFVIFLAIVVYMKVPGMMAKSLDDRADQIRNELAEAKRLREEAQHLLAEYQRKRKEAEAEAAHIVAAAEREAEMLTAEAKRKTEEFVANRTALSEQKIKQAESDAMKAPPPSTSPSPPPRRFSPSRPMPRFSPSSLATPSAK
jgi:F-type H+-transporting ATPase subunit b